MCTARIVASIMVVTLSVSHCLAQRPFINDRNPALTALAHGTNPTASLGSAKLIRKNERGPHEVPIPLNTILAAKSPDIELHADDVVFVPNSLAKSATRRGLEAILEAATGIAIYRRN